MSKNSPLKIDRRTNVQSKIDIDNITTIEKWEITEEQMNNQMYKAKTHHNIQMRDLLEDRRTIIEE